MEDERILTKHPAGKKGVNILRRHYVHIRDYIIDTVTNEGEITFSDLADRAVEELSDSFDGKVLWYITTVKLDLEAREIIERIPRTSPQVLRLKR
jgi:hypothetical protein